MDICEDFSQIFRISKPIQNDTNLPHPKFSKLCPKARLNSREMGIERMQEKRRKEHMEIIQRKRDNLLANLRRLVNIAEDCPSSPISPVSPVSPIFSPIEDDKELNNVDMKEYQSPSPSSSNNNKAKTNSGKKNSKRRNKESFERLISKQIMLSEWLVDVPEDLYNNWFMVCCPKGRRCIVIAAKGETKVYSRNGRLITQFQSHLPGGSKRTIQKSRKSTILDCIFVEEKHRFCILDIISWNGCTFFDCDTVFRFFWLRMKFEEEVRLEQEKIFGKIDNIFASYRPNNSSPSSSTMSQTSLLSNVSFQSNNSLECSVSRLYSFEPLEYLECTLDNVIHVSCLEEQYQSKIDGVLFFNKESPYTPGVTPLVCWLKISMFRDILKL